MACLVCGKPQKIYNTLRFLIIDDADPMTMDLSICNCGFGYYRHNLVKNIYSENNKYINSNSGSGADIKYDIMRLERTYANIIPHIKSTDRILDIGCNNGTFLSILYRNGFHNLTGTDFAINRNYTADLEQSGVAIYELSSLKDIDSSTKFDVITANHVLEHVDDIDQFITEIRMVLKEDGLLYIEVPDASKYVDKYFQPFSYFDLEHLNHFSLDNLILFLNKRGFEILNSYEFNIAMSDSINYPGIGVFMKKKETTVKNNTEDILSPAKRKLETYYEQSLAEIVHHNYTGSFDNIILYGVGANTLRTLGMLNKNIENVKYFVDKNPLFHGRKVMNKEIKSLDDLAADSSKPDIVIFSKLYFDDIVSDLKKKGIDNNVYSFF